MDSTQLTQLICEQVKFSYPGSSSNVDLLNDLSIRLTSGEFIAVVGKNGSGKTTLIRLLLGLLKPTSGSIYYGTKKISGVKFTSEIATIVPENSKLFLVGPTVIEDLTKIIKTNDAAYELLKKYNLDKLANKKLYELSEGQRRLIAVFNALHQEKKIFMLDEPTIGLDQGGIDLLINLSMKIVKEDRLVIVATNDVRILPYFDRIIGIEKGKISIDGPPNKVLFNLEKTLDLIPNQTTNLVSKIKSVKKDFPNLVRPSDIDSMLHLM